MFPESVKLEMKDAEKGKQETIQELFGILSVITI
jgi:hypothetical protein